MCACPLVWSNLLTWIPFRHVSVAGTRSDVGHLGHTCTSLTASQLHLGVVGLGKGFFWTWDLCGTETGICGGKNCVCGVFGCTMQGKDVFPPFLSSTQYNGIILSSLLSKLRD